MKRGVFAKRIIKKGEMIKKKDIFFAMPLLENQLPSGEWSDNIISDQDYDYGLPLNEKLAYYELSQDDLIQEIIFLIKDMLSQTKIYIDLKSSVEISHHYDLEKFREFGAIIINCINRDYCKKIVVQLPRQKHPYHCHYRKEETFQLLYGDLEVEVNGIVQKLNLGQTCLIKKEEWHKFHTLNGAIFEELSTTHYNDDSIYYDQKINRLSREKRKTKVFNF